MNETPIEITFLLSRRCSVRIALYGNVSQEAIRKLIAFMELGKDTFPTEEEVEAKERSA